MPEHEENADEQQIVGDDENLVDSEQEGEESTHRPVCQKISYILSEISIEPSLFLLMFGFGLYNVIAQV